ncbi:MAG: hypothetical protein V3W44_08075, partial [Dehalococcoidales bacterium]
MGGALTHDSPVQLLEGLELVCEEGNKHFHLEIEGEQPDELTPPSLNGAINFKFFATENLYSMVMAFWDDDCQRPMFILTEEGMNRASTFDRSLQVGKALGTAPVDNNYTLFEGFNYIDGDTEATGADLGVEDDIEAKGSIYAQENILAEGALRLADSDASNYVAFRAPSTVASDVTLTLPADDGTADQVLATDGSGALSWTNVSGTIADGTAANNTLRWNGTNWVQSTAMTNDGTDVAVSGDITLGDAATDTVTMNGVLQGSSPLVFEGISDNLLETTLTVSDPTADQTITLPDATGTVVLETRTLTTGVGLSGGGNLSADRTLELDIDGLTAESAINGADTLAIYDASALAVRKITRANFFSGITGALTYQGNWDANANNPALADGTGTQGHYYVIATSGSQDLGSGSLSFTVGDWVVHNGTAWEKLDNATDVQSVFGRTGVITATSGDYTAAMITNTPAGDIAAANVQAAINELDTEKQNAHAYLADIAGITANQGDIIYFDGTDWVDLAPGTNGQFLQTIGAGADPQWASPATVGAGTAANNTLRWDGSGWVESNVLTNDGTDITLTGRLMPNAHHTLDMGSDTSAFKTVYAKKFQVVGSETTFYHDGTDAHIVTDTGDFHFENEAAGGDLHLVLKTSGGGDVNFSSDMDGTRHVLLCDKADRVTLMENVDHDLHIWEHDLLHKTLYIHGITKAMEGIEIGREGIDGQLTLYAEQGAIDHSVVFQPNAAMTQDTTYTLPADDGTADQVLATDGSGALSWADGLTNSLTSANILVGNASDVATGLAMSGDATIDNAGALTIANDAVTTAKIADANVTTSKIEGLADARFIIGTDGTAANNSKAVMSGDVTMTNAGVATIGNSKVTSAKIADATIATADVASGGNDKILSTGGTGTVEWMDKSTFAS